MRKLHELPQTKTEKFRTIRLASCRIIKRSKVLNILKGLDLLYTLGSGNLNMKHC